MDRKSQAAFEYLLLLGGVLMIVLLVVTIIRGNVFPSAENTIYGGQEALNNLTNTSNMTGFN